MFQDMEQSSDSCNPQEACNPPKICDPRDTSRMQESLDSNEWYPPGARQPQCTNSLPSEWDHHVQCHSAQTRSGLHSNLCPYRPQNPISSNPQATVGQITSIPSSTAVSAAQKQPNYCLSGAGELDYGFYIPPIKHGFNTIVLGLTVKYCKESKVSEVTHRVLFPVREKFEIRDWTDLKRAEVVASINSVFESVAEQKLPSCLCNMATAPLAAIRDPRVLVRTMNSLIRAEKLDELVGDYSLEFAQSKDGARDFDTAAIYGKWEFLKQLALVTLDRGGRERLSAVLKEDNFSPPETVLTCKWGNVTLWEPGRV